MKGQQTNRARLARFFSRVEFTPTCWNWTGPLNHKGYGLFNGTSCHRFPYVWFVAQIPDGFTVDHRCLNKRCVNPAHLDAVSDSENRMRAKLLRDQKTHCLRGHSFDVFGRPYRGGRVCRECHRLRHLPGKVA